MKEDKGKNYSSNKGERTTKNWIKFDGTYNLLILCDGIWVSPVF